MFISEPIKPKAGSFNTARMAQGGPGVPEAFEWRGRMIAVDAVVKSWHTTGPCTHGSGEQYVRRHYFEVRTAEGLMKIYFDRQPKAGPKAPRWWLLSIEPGQAGTAN
jgi:hypothetical protein